MMLRMYQRWAERRGFEVEVDEVTEGQEAGILSATFIVQGRYAYGLLAAERGVHRLVRISPFDSQARRQTSFASLERGAVPRGPVRRGRDRREGPADRHLPVVGRRRPARQRDRLGGAPHPPADRHRRVVPERAQPAPEQGQGHADPRRPSWPSGSGRSGRAELEAMAGAQGPGRLGQPRSAPTCWRPTSWSRTCAPTTRPATSQAVLDGDLDEFMEAWLRWRRAGLRRG